MGKEQKTVLHNAFLDVEPPISRERAALLLGISVRGLDRLVAAKAIAHEHIGRRVILRASYLLQFIERMKITPSGNVSHLQQAERRDL